MSIGDKIRIPQSCEPIKKKTIRKFYKADETPSKFLCVLFGFQQVMVCVSALLVIPFILSDELCAGKDVNFLRVKLISATFCTSGISTIIQTILGMRLALLQGTAFAYIPSVQVFMQLPEFKCNHSAFEFVPENIYAEKMALIQGCLLVSACIPMVLGFTGFVGALTKFISPITVSSLMLLLVISSIDLSVQRIEKHWVAIVQAGILFATILYLADVRIPFPKISRGKFQWIRINLFGQYPYLIAILTAWLFCLFLTVTNLTPRGSEARVDKNSSLAVIRDASWFRVPYPGQFGTPKFHTGLFLAFVVSTLTSVFESVGDYHAIARVSRERPPPSHAINRGILAEGMGSFISGWLGPGIGITTHTENIGVIGITNVASRTTMIMAGILLIFLGIFTKIGAILSTIPDPLVGGVLASSMAMVAGVAIANLQQIDLKNTRNIAIFGFSIITGLIIPEYFQRHKIQTNNQTIDQILTVLLTMPMFVGGIGAFVLDNTVPGATRKQRGLCERGQLYELAHENRDIYNFPRPIMKFIEKFPFLTYIPIIPKQKKIDVNRIENGCTNATYIP